MKRRPGRPRTKPDGERISVYVSKSVLKEIDRHTSEKVSRSKLIEDGLKMIINGRVEFLEKVKEVEELKARLKELEKENEDLKKDRDYFEKKVEKLTAELEALRAKWKGQTKIDKYVKKSEEMRVLAEKIQEYIAERKTWQEVMVEAGILETEDQLKLFKKMWTKDGGEYTSHYFAGWKLREGRNRDKWIFGYEFRRVDDGHAVPQARPVEVMANA